MRDVICVDKLPLFYLVWGHKTAHSHEYWQDASVVALLYKFRVGFWIEGPRLLSVYLRLGLFFFLLFLPLLDYVSILMDSWN